MKLQVLIACAMSMAWCVAPARAVTTVVVVRHAEKRIEPENRDPMLTQGGMERARALAPVLRDIGIEAVYSSDYQRTRSTAAPVAEQAGVETLLYDPRDSDGLRDAILRDHRGGAVLVVGHSNTVPALLSALGVTDPPEIADDQYDDCFVVLIPDESGLKKAIPVMLRFHYGQQALAMEAREIPGNH